MKWADETPNDSIVISPPVWFKSEPYKEGDLVSYKICGGYSIGRVVSVSKLEVVLDVYWEEITISKESVILQYTKEELITLEEGEADEGREHDGRPATSRVVEDKGRESREGEREENASQNETYRKTQERKPANNRTVVEL